MELLHLITGEEACPYLPDEIAQFEFRIITGIKIEEYERLLHRGWRRFGHQFFRPRCQLCSKCVSFRLPISKFSPNRSQKRTLLNNLDIKVSVSRPSISEEHFDLYDRYHADMVIRKQWPDKIAHLNTYRETFVDGAEEFGYELNYRVNGDLVGVALFDVLSSTASSVYAYFDPAHRKRGLGVFSILKQIEFCAEHNRDFLHLGYWIASSSSMAYKSNYRPFEILRSRPELQELPMWVPPAS